MDPIKPKVQMLDGGNRLSIAKGGTLEVADGANVTGLSTGGDVKWGDIKEKPSTFAPTIGTTATTAMAGNTSIPAAPSAGTAELLQTGTDTTLRTWSAKMIADEIDRRISAASSSS